jgi:hypothetical protein
MESELVVCIPGPWSDRTDFLRDLVKGTNGNYMLGGMFLANPKEKDHITFEICGQDDRMRQAFEIAGQGKLSHGELEAISTHQSVAYLHFPLNILEQRDRIKKFSTVIQTIGGFAVKIESTGIAHSWEHWHKMLGSENEFDIYCGFVVLIGGEKHYYSCGMHNFGLPDCRVSTAFNPNYAADFMNRFNYYQITEKPSLESGHTFSIDSESPNYFMNLIPDNRHDEDTLFRNPFGLWDMVLIEKNALGNA